MVHEVRSGAAKSEMSDAKLQLLKDALELDLLDKEGLGSSVLADNLRDRMLAPFEAMTPADRKESQVWSALFGEFENYRAGKVIQRPEKFVQSDTGPEAEKLPPEEWR
jgi:hypothetical protein